MGYETHAPYRAAPEAPQSRLAALAARVRAVIADRSDTAVAQKVAGGAFLIRVVNAGIAFVSQILLARWMGESEYGVYVYVWTWVLLLGGLTSFGLASAPQRFIPEYVESGSLRLLRGFLVGSRIIAMISSTAIAAIGLAGVWLFQNELNSWAVVPLYLALVCVPMYVLTDVQDGIARSHNWIDVALAPAYFVRPLLILLLLGAMSYGRFAPTATTAMTATIIATWATALAQFVMLRRRLTSRIAPGPRSYAPSVWIKVSLPIFMVEGFYLLLAYTDVLMLSAFRPPQEVAVYYAAVKVMSLVAFVSFSVSAAVAHRFTEYSVAGDHERLATMVRDAARWTFWPSLAGAVIILSLGWPILWLFGESFTAGYPLLFVIAAGLLARAAVGPLERLLNMLGQQNICASVYGGAFLLNIALCLVLVPRLGMMGAAVSTAATLVIESVLLFVVTRNRLGLGALPWGRAEPAAARDVAPVAAAGAGDAASSRVELLRIGEALAHRTEWEALSGRALEANLFCEPDFALAADRLNAVKGVRIAMAWDDERAEGERLIAVVAIMRRGGVPFFGMRVSTEWAYFGALGAPVIDREHPERAVEALLRGLASHGVGLLMLRFLPEHGPAAEVIRAVCAAERPITRIEGHERAMLRTGQPAETYLTTSLSAKKLKELRRQLRRLGDETPVVFREARTSAGIAAALERFLDLEAKGWKGEAGTAMRFHDDQLGFIRRLFADRAAKGEARILELVAGDELIATGLTLTSGRQAWFYKTAYHEERSKCSPGVQLTIELTRRLIEDASIDMVDSTAIANHPMIDHVWRERLALADWLIPLRPGAARIAPAAAFVETARRRARTVVRDVYHRLKDRNP